LAGVIAAILVYLGGRESNPFTRLHGLVTKAEVRAVVGPPDAVEVLRRAECWTYGPQDGFSSGKVCFGERGRLAWFAYSRRSEQPPALLPTAPALP